MVSHTNMDKNFGYFMACAMRHIHPNDLQTLKFASESVDENFEAMGRFTATMAYNMLKHAGHEASAACQHMKLIATVEKWSSV